MRRAWAIGWRHIRPRQALRQPVSTRQSIAACAFLPFMVASGLSSLDAESRGRALAPWPMASRCRRLEHDQVAIYPLRAMEPGHVADPRPLSPAAKVGLALSAVALMVSSVLACEVVLRYRIKAFPFERALYVPEYLTARDRTLRWRFSSQDGRNRLGLRNREVNPKTGGIFRILFLGDSLIWSGETSSGDLYTVVLERRLNAKAPRGMQSVEVINAGIPGYTTYQELEFLKIYGFDMQPDLVVLGFVFNDVYYPYLHRPTKDTLLGPEPAVALYRFNPYVFPQKLFASSYLAHDLADGATVFWRTVMRRPSFSFERRRDFYLAWKDYGWIHARALIAEMKALVAERGIRLAVVVFPVSEQVDDQYRRLDEAYVLYPQRRIRQICDDLEIPTLDLTETIHGKGATTLFRDYLHLTRKGNDVITDELERYLSDNLENLGWSTTGMRRR
jgi:lysophospholipase L1-like esterase